MKRFQFNLERVLDLRKYREREAEIELGQAVGALVLIENRLKENAKEYHRCTGERFNGGHDLQDIRYYELYIQRLEKEKERLLSEAAQAAALIEEKRALYLAASKDRKVLDRLREKRAAEYRRAMLLEETKTLDDIAGGSVSRQKINKQ